MEGLKLLIKCCRVLVNSNMLRLNSDVKKYFEKAYLEPQTVLGDTAMDYYKKNGDEEENIIIFGKLSII